MTLDLAGLVLARHPIGRGWATLREVSDDHASRRADVVAVSCWASPFAVAYEMKATRADWLREMDDPGKRAWAERVCRFRWFACEPGCARPEEVPEGWGLLVVLGEGERRRLRRVVAAPAREVERLPKWLSRSLLRGVEGQRSAAAERDELRIVLSGETFAAAQAQVAAAQAELARLGSETAIERGRVEGFWNGLAELAGERAWQRNHGPARRDWDLAELWAVLQRRAAARVRKQAEDAARACQALVAAAEASASPVVVEETLA